MKVLNGQIWEAQESGVLRKLGQVGNIPFKDQLAISRLLKKLHGEYEALAAVRLNLFKEWGDEKNGQYTVPLEKKDAFVAKHNELMAMETEIQGEKVKVVLPGDAISVLTANDILTLEPFADISMKEDKK